MKGVHSLTCVFVLTTFLATTKFLPSSGIGINYGTLGDNLPNPPDVINLIKKCGIQQVRLFDPNHGILDALRNTEIRLTLGVRNEDLQGLASDPNAAITWVNTNLVPYHPQVSFESITLGNEVFPGPLAQYVPQAMNNIFNAITSTIGIGIIKVTTVVPMNVLGSSYPPSAGAFSEEVVGVMKDVTSFLSRNNFPLLLNVYPYFAYASNPTEIPLDYALFQQSKAKISVVFDGDLTYDNLFDAMVDAVNAALEKIGAGNVAITVSETGWASAGQDPYTTKENAQTYNSNLIKHIQTKGTPRKPSQLMNVFIFSMFNENQKPGGVEQNWGIFFPSMEPVYPLLECQA